MPRGERNTSRPYLRGKIWWIRYSVRGAEKTESSHSKDKNVAIRLLNLRRVQAPSISVVNATVNDLLNLYLADKEKNKSQVAQADGYVRLHLGPAFGKLAADDVTTERIDRFILQKQVKYQNGTINRWLAALKRAYTLGRKHKPRMAEADALPEIEMLDETDDIRQGYLTYEEYIAIRNELPDHLRMVLVIGYHLGFRRGEILNLRWEQVEFRAGVIRLEIQQTKGNQARTAPIYGELKTWLSAAFAIRDPECPYVVSLKGHGISETKTAWTSAAVRAGCPGKLIHDLRRTAVRNMVRAGVSEKRAMVISGHRTRAMFDRYDITSDRDVQADGEMMAAYTKKLKVAATPGKKVRAKVRAA
jgi:integrase